MDKTLLTCDSMELWHRFLDERGFITQQDKQTRKRLHDEYMAGSLDIYENFKLQKQEGGIRRIFTPLKISKNPQIW